VGQRRTRQASAAEDKARKRGASKASTKGTKAVLAAGASMLEQVEFSSGCVLSVAGPTSVKSVVFEGQPANRHHAAAGTRFTCFTASTEVQVLTQGDQRQKSRATLAQQRQRRSGLLLLVPAAMLVARGRGRRR
jgi:hypothetical protein